MKDLTFTAFDVETSGGETKDTRIIEMAAVRFNLGPNGIEVQKKARARVALPLGIRISPEASGVHNITEEQLIGCPSLKSVFRKKFVKMLHDSIVVIHNADFDWNVLLAHQERCELGDECEFLLPELPFVNAVLDTLRFSRNLLSEVVTRHNLGTLFYHYGCRLDNPGRGFHSALVDCTALAQVFYRLVRDWEEEQKRLQQPSEISALLQFIYTPRSMKTIPFGKHKGVKLEECPPDYLQWWLFKRPDDQRKPEDMDKDYAFSREWLRRAKLHPDTYGRVKDRAQAIFDEATRGLTTYTWPSTFRPTPELLRVKS